MNPLLESFQQKRIYIKGFLPPFEKIVKNKTFIECEIIGPFCIGFSGCQVSSCKFVNTAGASIANKVPVPASLLFVNCTFLRCTIVDIILMVPEFQHAQMYEGLKGLPWLTLLPQSPVTLSTPART